MEERDGRGKTWWEVVWSGDSGRLLLHRRNTVHFKRTNEPPPKLTFEESPKVSSYPDDTGDRVHLEESFDTEEAPCIEPCKDTLEQDLVGIRGELWKNQATSRTMWLEDLPLNIES